MTSQTSSTNVACTAGEESPVGAAAETDTVQRPSASTEIRWLSTAPLGTVPKRATDARVSVSESVRKAGPAPVGTRFSGTAACSRASETATPVWRATEERRIGSASNRPTIQPVAAGTSRTARSGHAAAAVDRGDDLEHLVSVAGGDHERAELTRVARVGEQVRELAEVEAGNHQLVERRGHAGAGDGELGQAVVRALAGGIDVLALLAHELDVAEAGDAGEAAVDVHRADTRGRTRSSVRSGVEPSSVRAASVRSSILRTAVVTDVLTEDAWAAKAWSFWRWTWPRQSAALRTARTTKTASSSQDIHVRAPPVSP